ELVAGGDIALGDVELVCPTGDGVLVVADQGGLAPDQVPGAGAAGEGIDLVPLQVSSPAPHGVTRRATTTARQQGEADVFHLVEVPDPFQPDDRGEDAGQQAALQAPRGLAHPAPGGGAAGGGC